MTLITFLITIVVIGVVVWLIETYVPMPESFKSIIRIVAVIVVILLVLSLFGIMSMPFALK